MKQMRKIINYVSWLIIIILGIMLVIHWNRIPEFVMTDSGLGMISYGNKVSLIALYILEIIVNTMFTIGQDIPFIREVKKTKISPILVDVISIIIQMLVLIMICAFIILPMK